MHMCIGYAIASHEILIIHTITIKINAYLFWEWIMASSGSVESFSYSRAHFNWIFGFCVTLFLLFSLCVVLCSVRIVHMPLLYAI